MKTFPQIIIIVLLFAVQHVFGNPSGSDSTEIIVKLQLKWKHQFQFAGYYAAIEKGYYMHEGLHVELIEAQEGKEPGEAVLTGIADFAVGTSDIVLMRAAGKPVVVLAAIFQHSPLVLVASKNSGIEHVQNLLGKKLMIEPHAADLMAFMHHEGVSMEECTLFPHSFDVTKLVDNSVDALTAYMTDEPFLLQADSFDYTIISPISGGIDFYGDVLFTSEEMIHKDPVIVKKFLTATIKGWKYAMAHPDELIEIIHSEYSDRHSRAHLTYEAEKMRQYIMQDVVEIGYMNRGRWESIINTYKEVGLIEEPITTSGLLYEDYLPEESHIPWAMIGLLFGVVVVAGSITFFFYRLNRKLKHEIEGREVIQQQLEKREGELEELNATKDSFFSIIAHDLINPFNTIIGFSSILADNVADYSPEEVAQMSARIHSQATNTHHLLENLLAWSKSQSGRMPFKPKKIKPEHFIQDILLSFMEMASQKGVNIKMRSRENLELFADKNMLRSIIGNLIVNAIKFSHPNGLVTLSVTPVSDAIEIMVADQGVGMSDEDLAGLFDIQTSDVSLGTENEKGTGLGLVLCKEFAEHHGGSIRVESKLGEGSKVTISLPNLT